ncbi:hypothetical protein [Paenibacillus sp. sgz500958]|uniref:hypothetical protein n=1 Tax=Paenibacillus sp. sgz500958 TaxID=3242475 RepID=UPI0036D3BFDD
MNTILLLLGLLTPYLHSSAVDNPFSAAAAFSRPTAIQLAFQHIPPPAEYINDFNDLGGIPLFVSEEEVLKIKGVPQDITKDPFQDCLEYQYKDITAGICDGIVIYVHITPEQAQHYGLFLNGVELDPTKNNLRGLLGSPDFKAEDGDVYMRGNVALKIYRDTITGEWQGIDLFDGNSS